MAEEWGPPESTRTIFFQWNDNPKSGERFLNSNSLSGGERNRIFLRRDGNYKDMSLVSGADFREDGRGFVLFDFDRDGWLDLGVTSPNHPRFRIVRNTIGDQTESTNQFIEISLVGGNPAAAASSQWSPRDPYGARVLVTTGDRQRMFQLSCGEGLSGVNAKRIHVGMGSLPSIDKLEVFWPSGRTTVRQNVLAGQRVTIFENPNHQPDGH